MGSSVSVPEESEPSSIPAETAPSSPIPSIPEGCDLRIVLIGKTGVGKSAVGNTILGLDPGFESRLSASSVTQHTERRENTFFNRKISVVDTPGILDIEKNPKVLGKEILRCIQYSSPGPHAIVLVMQAGRFTKEEQNSVEALQKLFGKTADKYMIVLFTHGDAFVGKQTIADFVTKAPKGLQEVIQRCGSRFHVFDNTSKDRHQVVELIKKIDTMVAVNGNTYYTNKMYRETETFFSQQAGSQEDTEKQYMSKFLPEFKELIIEFLKTLRKVF